MLLYKLFENWGPQEFQQHFKDVQKFYQERRDMMLTMVEKHLNGIIVNFKKFLTVLKSFITVRDLKTILLEYIYRKK